MYQNQRLVTKKIFPKAEIIFKILAAKRRVSQKASKNAKKTKTEEKPPISVSTLEHFAREGGLIELSKHIYLYRRCLTRLHSWYLIFK